MKRVARLAAIPFLVSVAFVSSSLAEGDLGSWAQADIGAGTTVDTGDELSFGAVISAIQTSDETAAEIEAMAEGPEVEIIRVSDIASEESEQALKDALSQHETQIEALRSAIEANATLLQRLKEEQVSIESVVAASTETDNGLIIYVR